MTPSALSPANAALLNPGMEPTVPPLRALTLGLARGDDAAWSQFHRDYGPRLFRQLLATARGDHDLATEALQQTYLRIARHLRACDLEPVFLAWLRVVARSALHDCLRRHAEPADSDSASASEDHLLAALDTALAQLPAETRTLLEAKYSAGATVQALAAQHLVSPKALESRLTRARAELRQLILAALSRHE